MEDLLHPEGFFGELFQRSGVISYHIQTPPKITGSVTEFVIEGATQSSILSLDRTGIIISYHCLKPFKKIPKTIRNDA